MADEKDNAAAGSARGGRRTTVIVVGAIMLVEGVGIYLAVNMLTQKPEAAAAAALEAAKAEAAVPPEDSLVEAALADCRVVNAKEGRLYRYSIRVSVLVERSDLERLQKLIESRRSRIDERINIALRSAEPRQLKEPGFETLKRRLKADLADVFGDNALVRDVIIPELIQTGGD
ncbi:MAG: hypothetical protein C4547_09830 [Phycisphaerales bacterium]|nr:MAG: hypothetical protein C4547_09830 [Phycisphaerales bacterium]